MHNLRIHLHSIQIDKFIVRRKDKIRVCISSYPDQSKAAFIIRCRKMNNVDRILKINVSKETKTILFLFEKKSFFQNNPTIASTDISKDEIPQSPSDPNNNDIKSINIYEPIIYKDDTYKSPYENRKVIGKLIFKMTVTEPLPKNIYSNQTQVKVFHKRSRSLKYNTNRNSDQIQDNDLIVNRNMSN